MQFVAVLGLGIVISTCAMGASGPSGDAVGYGMHVVSPEELICAEHLKEETLEWATDDHEILSPEDERALLTVFYHAKRFSSVILTSSIWRRVLPYGLKADEEDEKLAEKAKQVLLSHNIRFVGWYIKRFRMFIRRMDWQDIFQAGMLGLGKAIEKFELSFGTRLNTYAGYHIRNEVQIEIAVHAFSHVIPLHWLSYFYKWCHIENRLRKKVKRRPELEEVHAEYLREVKKKAGEDLPREKLMKRLPPSFFDKPIFFERMRNLKRMLRGNYDVDLAIERSKTFLWWLPRVQQSTADVEEKAERQELLRELLNAKGFPKAQRETLKLRFGIWDVDEFYGFFQRRFGGRLLGEEEYKQLHYVMRMKFGDKPPPYSEAIAEEIYELLLLPEPVLQEMKFALVRLMAILGLDEKAQVDRLHTGFARAQIVFLRGKDGKGKISTQAVDDAKNRGLLRIKKMLTERNEAQKGKKNRGRPYP